jgi:lipopolysaccharide transport system ATP-binding protein
MPSAGSPSRGLASGGFRKHDEALPMSSERHSLTQGRQVEESLSSHREVAIRATCISKCYHLYDKPQDRLKQTIFPHFQRLLRIPVETYSREFWALKDVSFEVKKGQTVGIIGRNGSGKSTLLQIIAGTLDPTHGKVEVNGRVAALLELGSGFNPEFTGRENVYMNATILGLTKKEIDARFDDIVSFAEIGEFIEQPVKTYSSGMYVRLAFAVQVAVEPDVLIIDEALSVGDMRFSMKCIRRMRELVDKGTSCIFVSHDMSSVVNFCTNALWLHDGMIFEKGEPKRITIDYANFMTYGLLPAQKAGTDACIEEHLSFSCGENVKRKNPIVIKKFLHENLKWIDLCNAPSTGVRGATIKQLCLSCKETDRHSLALSGGEDVEVFLYVTSTEHLKCPNVCAHFLDKKGNTVFGVNTHFVKRVMPEVLPNKEIIIKLKLTVPLVLNGQYGVAVAICDGPLQNHILHHMVCEAMTVNIFSPELARNHYFIAVPSGDFELLELN